MKKTLLLITTLFVSQANAAVLSFDDISGVGVTGDMPVYNGFTFSTTLDWFKAEAPSLWNYGTKSGDFILVNMQGGPGTITEENRGYFTFDGLWAKKFKTPKESGGTDSLFGTLEGYNNGTLAWTVNTSLNGSYEYYDAQSGLIDELRLGFGDNFSVDDLSLTVSPVPEPSSIALMLGGLGLIGFMAARRTKKVSL
ncbi:MAG: PEP-CTERM sorting domain-containing protein [Thiomicrorhabdus sp.]|nr:PEP-CTERM sorting domain-containing protein [Thiomicrorhabdus sp.]